jgi:hypothetical protein
VPAQQAHLPDGGPGVPAPEAGAPGEPGGGAGVPVGVAGAVGVEPAQQPALRGGQPGRDRPDLRQRFAARGPVQLPGGRGVQVVGDRAARAQRLHHAPEPRTGATWAG